VFIPLVVASLYNLARMRLVLFPRRVRKETHVVVHIKIEQGSRLSPRLVDDKVVERVMLKKESAFSKMPQRAGEHTWGMIRSS
jgi:hypothetical protein